MFIACAGLRVRACLNARMPDHTARRVQRPTSAQDKPVLGHLLFRAHGSKQAAPGSLITLRGHGPRKAAQSSRAQQLQEQPLSDLSAAGSGLGNGPPRERDTFPPRPQAFTRSSPPAAFLLVWNKCGNLFGGSFTG